MTKEKPRWEYRFDNYKRAFILLREAVEKQATEGLNQLEKEGTIQRFEYTWELAWNVLKDYLEYKGVTIETVTPSDIIRAGYTAGIIHNGETWMKALDARNKMSHTYNFKTFEKVIEDIRYHYLAILDDLHLYLLEKIVEGNVNG